MEGRALLLAGALTYRMSSIRDLIQLQTIDTALSTQRTALGEVLRAHGCRSVKQGCDNEGTCGACTVLLNGRSVKSCSVLAVQADGKDVTTIQGIAEGEDWHPVQKAFKECHGLQCGFCTPGMLLTALDLLRHDPTPTRDEVRAALSGNLCRCTGYQQIVDAVLDAARGGAFDCT